MTADNKIQKAVALFYDGKNTPTVTAKGTGAVAENIMAIAEQHGVPLCDNSALVELLVQLELGDEIPETLYLAVAYIIAFAYQLEGKEPENVVQKLIVRSFKMLKTVQFEYFALHSERE